MSQGICFSNWDEKSKECSICSVNNLCEENTKSHTIARVKKSSPQPQEQAKPVQPSEPKVQPEPSEPQVKTQEQQHAPQVQPQESPKGKLAVEDVLLYELSSSWMGRFASWNWLRELVAGFYARKVRKKLAQYERFLAVKKELQVMKDGKHE